MMADKTLFGGRFGFIAFLADKLTNFIIYDSLLGFKIVTTFVYFAMAFGTDENFEALIDFFDRHFTELGETYIAVRLKNFFV
jgi:hypothetical protein